MKVALFDTQDFERHFFDEVNSRYGYELTYFDARLTAETAPLVFGFDVLCPFVHDRLDEATLRAVHVAGVKLISLRTTGFNHIDLEAASRLGIPVTRVPFYSPHAVAEHAMGLILALDRKLIKANSRVHEGNFSLTGLVGFNLHGKTVGLIGTGRIGSALARILRGFGCRILAHDLNPDPGLSSELGVRYADLRTIYSESDILSLHVPLTPDTRHLIDAKALAMTRRGVMLINTGRGELVDTHALIEFLKTGHIGYAGLDVYEEEENLFYKDLSERVLQDDVLARLLTFPNVLITSHQAFLTREALTQVAEITLQNIADFIAGTPLKNQVFPEKVIRKAA